LISPPTWRLHQTGQDYETYVVLIQNHMTWIWWSAYHHPKNVLIHRQVTVVLLGPVLQIGKVDAKASS
jgi:hypothetical protein